MSQDRISVSPLYTHILFYRTSSRTLGWSALAFILSLSGCIQDAPPSSRDRTISLLLELLHDERPDMRRTAVESLGKIGDPRAKDSILPLVHDPALMVREAAVKTVGRLKPANTEAVMLLLTQALEDPAESVRQAAAVAIGEIEPEARLLTPLVALLQSSDPTIKRAAVRALLQVDASQWVPELITAGRDTDAAVREGIVAVLGEWGGPAVSPWLRERLAQDPSPEVRAEAAYRLGMRSDHDTKAALETAGEKDADSGVRRWAKRGA